MLREDHGRVAILFSCLPEPVSSTIEERRYIIFSPGIGEKNMYIRIKSALRKWRECGGIGQSNDLFYFYRK